MRYWLCLNLSYHCVECFNLLLYSWSSAQATEEYWYSGQCQHKAPSLQWSTVRENLSWEEQPTTSDPDYLCYSSGVQGYSYVYRAVWIIPWTTLSCLPALTLCVLCWNKEGSHHDPNWTLLSIDTYVHCMAMKDLLFGQFHLPHNLELLSWLHGNTRVCPLWEPALGKHKAVYGVKQQSIFATRAGKFT